METLRRASCCPKDGSTTFYLCFLPIRLSSNSTTAPNSIVYRVPSGQPAHKPAQKPRRVDTVHEICTSILLLSSTSWQAAAAAVAAMRVRFCCCTCYMRIRSRCSRMYAYNDCACTAVRCYLVCPPACYPVSQPAQRPTSSSRAYPPPPLRTEDAVSYEPTKVPRSSRHAHTLPSRAQSNSIFTEIPHPHQKKKKTSMIHASKNRYPKQKRRPALPRTGHHHSTHVAPSACLNRPLGLLLELLKAGVAPSPLQASELVERLPFLANHVSEGHLQRLLGGGGRPTEAETKAEA